MARSYAKAYDDVWGDKRLSNNDVIVYTGLVRHSYGDSMTVKRIGVRKLAEYCRVTPNTFNSCVKHLVECGWLEVVKGGKYGDADIASEYHLLTQEVEEDTTPSEKPDTTSPVKQKTHKTLKPSKKSSDTSSKGGYSDKRKSYFKTLKTYAESLDIADAWRCEILEWVNRVLDSDETVMDSHTPKDLFMLGTRKLSNSDLRWTE